MGPWLMADVDELSRGVAGPRGVLGVGGQLGGTGKGTGAFWNM